MSETAPSAVEQMVAELVGVESALDQARERLRKALVLGPVVARSQPATEGLREALLRYGAKHLAGCVSTTLGADPRCTCGLSAALAATEPAGDEQ